MHFVIISTEHDFMPGSPQYKFIEKDLASVNRTETPWVIAMSHRPMYSSTVYAQGSAKEQMAHFKEAVSSN